MPGLRRATLLIVFAVLTTIALGPGVMGGLNRFDEGFVVTGAMLIRRGWLPIQDFYVIYGPGQYYLTAAAFQLAGENLMVSALLHMALLVTLGTLLLVHARTLCRDHRALVVVVALGFIVVTGVIRPNRGYAAVPASLCVLLSLLGLQRWGRRGNLAALSCASVCAGLAGLFRWDFGIFGLLALALTLAWVLWTQHSPLRRFAVTLAVAVLPGLAVLVAGFAPFLADGNAGRWFADVPLFLLRELHIWRNLDFIAPTIEALRAAYTTVNLWALAYRASDLLLAALPFVAAGAGLVISALRIRRSRGVVDVGDTVALMLALVVLFMLNQVRVRSSLIQGYPAIVLSLPIMAYVLGLALQPARAARRWPVALGLVAVWLLPAQVLRSEWLAALHQQAVPGGPMRASQLRISQRAANLQDWRDSAALIHHLQATTAPHERIYSGVSDTSRLWINDALLYFLADRLPATRWVEMEPGLSNTPSGQAEIIEALQRYGVRTVVLWSQSQTREPNATARSNGTHDLDDYIRTHFEPDQVFGDHAVWRRRLSQ